MNKQPMFPIEEWDSAEKYAQANIVGYEPNYRVKLAKRNFTKHGQRNTRLYNIWCCVKARCNRKSHTYYHNDGGRGIKVCEDWNDFNSFYKWSISSGYDDALTLDRIDNDGNYEPDNCRWVTRKTQNRNSRNCHYLEFRGKVKTLTEWCEILNLPMKTISLRINRLGWSVERALTEPIHSKGVV